MTINLLPKDFDERVASAVSTFWQSRGSRNAPSGREAVVGGKNMDGFVELVRAVVSHCGLPPETVQMRKSQLILPGFFRARGLGSNGTENRDKADLFTKNI
ncbi:MULTISPECIES: PaeR7I family type II restriction endonuclease [Pseudomonadota]|uniref:PaeR7I family type II restriction endonuclease n=1 Tax=Pseudomonadota TaxID=1224 RepID=UPI00122A20A6|nr:PaeR7I family type II restriction endonuclease [Paraburkholderia sp.]TAL99531.1 MAG: hypothetical protein EPN70_25035 [Paraburkholderia sp.]